LHSLRVPAGKEAAEMIRHALDELKISATDFTKETLGRRGTLGNEEPQYENENSVRIERELAV